MKVAVRYYSKLGNTKQIAEAISKSAGVKAISVSDEPELTEKVDILFLGGAPYANVMAPELREYAERLTADKVDRVALFTTSNWSRRTVRALRNILEEKGITVDEEYFYAHMTRIKSRLEPAREYAKKVLG